MKAEGILETTDEDHKFSRVDDSGSILDRCVVETVILVSNSLFEKSRFDSAPTADDEFNSWVSSVTSEVKQPQTTWFLLKPRLHSSPQVCRIQSHSCHQIFTVRSRLIRICGSGLSSFYTSAVTGTVQHQLTSSQTQEWIIFMNYKRGQSLTEAFCSRDSCEMLRSSFIWSGICECLYDPLALLWLKAAVCLSDGDGDAALHSIQATILYSIDYWVIIEIQEYRKQCVRVTLIRKVLLLYRVYRLQYSVELSIYSL